MDAPISVTYRIYKNTIQRFPSSITILNSYACYIIDSDKKNKRYIWIGRLASDDDKQISLNIYEDMCKEPRPKLYSNNENEKKNYIIFDEDDTPELIGLLTLLCGNEDEYNKHRNARLQQQTIISNSYKTLYSIENNNNYYSMKKINSVSPTNNGYVPKLLFPDVTSTSMIGLLVADQWDLWLGEATTLADINAAIALLIESGETKKDILNNNSNVKEKVDISYYRHTIKKTREGYERIPFKINFEPNIKFGYKLKKFKISEDESDIGCINMTAIADIMNISWVVQYFEQNNIFIKSNNEKKESNSNNNNNNNNNEKKKNKDGIELQSFKSDQDISSIEFLDDAFEFKNDLNIEIKEQIKLLNKFKEKPSHLVGWQIDVEKLGLGVVVDYHTSSYVSGRKQYALRLDDKDSPEIWVTLNMNNYNYNNNNNDCNEEEYNFTLLRNVNRKYISNPEHVIL